MWTKQLAIFRGHCKKVEDTEFLSNRPKLWENISTELANILARNTDPHLLVLLMSFFEILRPLIRLVIFTKHFSVLYNRSSRQETRLF